MVRADDQHRRRDPWPRRTDRTRARQFGADRNGVVVVRFERIDDTIAAIERVTAAETGLDAAVADGLKIPDAIADLLDSDKVRYTD